MPTRCSAHRFSKDINPGKQTEVEAFLEYYAKMVRKFVNILWNDSGMNTTGFIDSVICNKISTGRVGDSRIRQCASKQASAIVRGALEKHRKRLHVLGNLQKDKSSDTSDFQSHIDRNAPSKPDLKHVNAELDSRFVDIREVDGRFDIFIKISSIGDGKTIKIPIKKTKMSKKWLARGRMAKSIRLCRHSVTFFYDIPEVPKKTQGETVGGDQGLVTCMSLSDGQTTKKDIHGHDLNSICECLARRKKGSKGFKRKQDHRENYVNWSIKQLDLSGFKTFRLERVMHVRRGRKSYGKMQHWVYPLIKTALESRGELEGFKVVEVDNKFRSQRCSRCGWVHKSNRRGKVFRCRNPICGMAMDADLNSSLNVRDELCDTGEAWRRHLNRKAGFFWRPDGLYDKGGEPIVPRA